MNFKELLDIQKYDKYYQDIEYLNFEGYAKSSKSWENIKDLVDWVGKTVVDIGCFHGYFCFKVEQAGATTVLGVDINPEVLEVTRTLASLMNSGCDFVCQEAEKSRIGCDILLCLNVFHHIKDQNAFLKGLKTELVIFEIDPENLGKIKEFCNILVNKPSHRPSLYTGDVPNRLVLLATRRT